MIFHLKHLFTPVNFAAQINQNTNVNSVANKYVESAEKLAIIAEISVALIAGKNIASRVTPVVVNAILKQLKIIVHWKGDACEWQW